jgi:hypothetical protein
MAKRQRRAQRQAAPRDPRTDADDTIEHESAESPAQEAQEDPGEEITPATASCAPTKKFGRR